MAQPETPIDQFKRATINTVRALCERDDVQVGFTAEPAGVIGNRAKVPLPQREMEPFALDVLRGMADGAALRLKHHDAHVFQTSLPLQPEAAKAFTALEDARIEALGARDMLGVAHNLETALENRYRQEGYARFTKREEMPMAEALRLLTREALTGEAPPPAAHALLELWRPQLSAKLGKFLPRLVKVAEDQQLYARLARDLLRQIELDEGKTEPQDEETSETPEDEPPSEAEPDQSEEEGDGEEEPPPEDSRPSSSDEEPAGEQMVESSADSPPDDEDNDHPVPSGPSQRPDEQADLENLPGYQAFTRAFDETVLADTLADADELSRLRDLLDRQLQPLQGTIARLANRLQRRLLAQQQRSWQFDLEEGLLDSARLARVVANPTMPLTFKREKDTEFRDTVVTLLIDNSGSMRGRPITIAALSADILARTLERCAVKVEILGFTTRAWKGGKARELWVQQGKPVNPGRLNDLRHIIYKPADAPWRRVRRSLGLMLREGILKENIDGEALIWAYQRLMARPEQRRILMVISDGAPVDDATLSVNTGTYLETHLRGVIDWIEKRSPVQLMAIGIGHDVTRYYSRAVTIVDVEQLGGTMMEKLAEMFDDRAGPRRR